MRWARAVGLFALYLSCAQAVAADAPRGTELTAMSDEGRFRVALSSAAVPVPLNQLHAWRVAVARPDGTPVAGALIAVSGEVPEVPRDLPTEPRVTGELPGGVYVVDGVRFNMAGRWRLKLVIESGEDRDSVAFDIDVGASVP